MRKIWRIPTALFIAALLLTGCTGGGTPGPNTSTSGSESPFDGGDEAYDAVINAGQVAEAEVIEGSEWVKGISEAGVLRLGVVKDSALFSLENDSGALVGFDAGMGQLLSRYIFGEVKVSYVEVSDETREDVLASGKVDAVISTYTITAARMERVSFAGPYFQTQTAILVAAGTDDIASPADLAGRTVVVQSGSTAIAAMNEFAPEATVQELPTDAECRAALKLGTVDAYVTDLTIAASAAVGDSALKVAGEGFGASEYYGIGLPKGTDAKRFVDSWLQRMEAKGTWNALFDATLAQKAGVDLGSTPPGLNTAGNARS
jgi:glutamate transport system substrate-binding protein